MSCGIEKEANDLMLELMKGESFPTINDADLSSNDFAFPPSLTDALKKGAKEITNKDWVKDSSLEDGSYDAIMTATLAALSGEYNASRITGAEYTKAYIALVQQAQQISMQFLLGKDAAHWQAVTAQMQAIRSRVELESIKAEYAITKVKLAASRAEFAMRKLQLGTESMNYCKAKYELEQLLPLSKASQELDNQAKEYNLNTTLPLATGLLSNQVDGQKINNDLARFDLQQMSPIKKDMLLSQTSGQKIENDTRLFNLDQMLPVQKEQLVSQTAGVVADTKGKVYQTDQILPIQKETMEVDKNTKSYQLYELLPLQKALSAGQITAQNTDNAVKQYSLTDILPSQKNLAVAQAAGQVLQNDQIDYTVKYLLPSQLAINKEGIESKRAETLDTRTDGTLITGNLGAQKKLHEEQIVSFKKDSDLKGVRLFSDLFQIAATVAPEEVDFSPVNGTKIGGLFDSYIARMNLNSTTGS